MKFGFPHRFLFTLPAGTAVLATAAEAFARAGGGHSYSGGGNGGSGGGGGSIDGQLVELAIWLVFRHPQVGIPVVVVCGACYYLYSRSNRLPSGFSTASGSSLPAANRETAEAVRSRRRLPVVPMLARDPKFSLTLFLDFVSALAHRSLSALNTPESASLEPYVTAATFSVFPADIRLRNVVVGAVAVRRIQPPADRDRITAGVAFCATASKGEKSRSYWFETEWHFSRKAGVVSKGPAETLKLACPSCGATADKDPSGACAYCGSRPAPGDEAWTVEAIAIQRKETRPPVDLGSYAEEKGTSLPTRFSPMLRTGMLGITSWDHSFSVVDAEMRFRSLFTALQEAWSRRDPAAIRPLVTDQLYRVYTYWIEAYRAAGIRNLLTDVSVTRVEIVDAGVDPFYDSITARIFAAMADRCVDESGRTVGGSDTPRAFSEYWTFVRVSGGKATADADQTCSGCGASITVGMTGVCPYCGMLVSGRNFDWVLSRIAQDEEYAP